MKFASVVLAAGSATRFGADKLSAQFRGKPLVHHAIDAARAAPVERVIVVARPGLAVGDWEGNPPVDAIALKSNALSDSLRTGIAATGDADGAFVFLGDMPLVPHDIAALLVASLGTSFAAVPRHKGRLGHPVLLSRRAFDDVHGLQGDQGAGGLIRSRDDIVFAETPNLRIHIDVDRPEDLARLEDKAPEQ